MAKRQPGCTAGITSGRATSNLFFTTVSNTDLYHARRRKSKRGVKYVTDKVFSFGFSRRLSGIGFSSVKHRTEGNKLMLKRWLFYLFSLAGAIAFYGAYTKYISFYILAAVLLLPLFSLLISLPAMVRMRVEYSMLGGEVVRGDEARLEVKLRQRWIYTLPEAMLRYSDTNITLTKEIRQKTSYIGTDSCVSIRSHLTCRMPAACDKKIRIYDYLVCFFAA